MRVSISVFKKSQVGMESPPAPLISFTTEDVVNSKEEARGLLNGNSKGLDGPFTGTGFNWWGRIFFTVED